MRNATEIGKRLYLENQDLRDSLKAVTARLEGFCSLEESKEVQFPRGKINTKLARADIRQAREILDRRRKR